MAARWSDKSWTDADVRVLLEATVYLTRYCLGHEHFAHLRPRAEKWRDAMVGFIVPPDGSRARARLRLQSLAREIASSHIDWSQDLRLERAAGCSEEPTTTPEETLRRAGISSRRQARYQRRMSSLLAGRAETS